MPDKTSPIWWLFAAISVAAYVAIMLPGMITTRQKIIYSSGGPLAGLGALMAYSVAFKWPVNDGLPLYCAVILGIAAGMVGHKKSLRSYMADRLANPGRPQGEVETPPWVLQMVFTVLVLCGAALWYIRNF
ncbi:hypothetical protein [Streptomyces sp. MBT27]|uniref:hypothetical protein n=1 Tax=Streptomyces sp. MBT27 TaxID=1488356 RepID=UPI00141DF2EB|nr:hypothetical protein [Streptomyces sp. MBT27]